MHEAILFLIDLSEAHRETIASSGSSRIDVLRQLLLFFSACKLKTNPSTRFSIGSCTTGGKVELLKTRGTHNLFTSDTEELAIMLTESVAFAPKTCINAEDAVDEAVSKPFAMDSVLSALFDVHQSLKGAPYQHRVMFVSTRSFTAPSFSPPPPLPPNHPRQSGVPLIECTMDSIFVHCKPNSQEEVDLLHSIFSTLDTQCQTISSSSFLPSTPNNASKSFYMVDQTPSMKRPGSYIYEASLHSPAAIRRVLGAFVQLLSPTNVRPPQGHLPSTLIDLATLPLKLEATQSQTMTSALSNSTAHSTAPVERKSSVPLGPIASTSEHVKNVPSAQRDLLDLI